MNLATVLSLGLIIGCGLGCGSVAPSEPVDEQEVDASPICLGDTVDGCGPTCTVCESEDDREVPSCDGTMCAFSCVGSAPTCSSGSCSSLRWGFDSGAFDGIEAVEPVGLPLRIAEHLNSQALAIELTSLTQVSFRLPICNSGTIDFSDKTFRFEVFFDGGNPEGEQYFVQASLPSPMSGAFLGTQGVQAGINTAVSALFSDSTFSADAAQVTIQASTFGAPFAGTIWFDNFRIE